MILSTKEIMEVFGIQMKTVKEWRRRGQITLSGSVRRGYRGRETNLYEVGLLDALEMAEKFSVTKHTIYNWELSGRIKSMLFEGKKYYNPNELVRPYDWNGEKLTGHSANISRGNTIFVCNQLDSLRLRGFWATVLSVKSFGNLSYTYHIEVIKNRSKPGLYDKVISFGNANLNDESHANIH